MVGPGEVDDELEPEIKEECVAKYGEIESVIRKYKLALLYRIKNTLGENAYNLTYAIHICIGIKRKNNAKKKTTEFMEMVYLTLTCKKKTNIPKKID